MPDGKYCIYYFRPKNRNRLIGGQSTSCSALDKIKRVGKGQEFYIFDKNSSQSPSKTPSEATITNSSVEKQKQKVSSTAQLTELYGSKNPTVQGIPIRQLYSHHKVGAKVLEKPKLNNFVKPDSLSTEQNLLNLSPEEVDALICNPDS